ncbi:hypothetical protein AB8A28_16785 [Tardiphaga sp. 71_E8_N1_1]|uniref:hypothetical protein n=1 Tax=Tardiphaga sp. 71_E8_N1_1 TaxID=3240784 RepID=UPI003F8C9340
MPIPPASVIDMVSRHLGIPRATVAMQDRLLVKDGYRQLSGRGRAASVSCNDAAAVLLAVAATPISGPAIAETVIHYRRYADLQATDQIYPVSYPGLWDLDQLAEGHSLQDATTALIDKIARGRFERVQDIWKAGRTSVDTRFDPQDDVIEVSIEMRFPFPEARVTISAFQERAELVPGRDLLDPVFEPIRELLHQTTIDYVPTIDTAEEFVASLQDFKGAPGGRVKPDLKQVRSFGLATLHPLGSLFRTECL